MSLSHERIVVVDGVRAEHAPRKEQCFAALSQEMAPEERESPVVPASIASHVFSLAAFPGCWSYPSFVLFLHSQPALQTQRQQLAAGSLHWIPSAAAAAAADAVLARLSSS
jgi:hypothetical protein